MTNKFAAGFAAFAISSLAAFADKGVYLPEDFGARGDGLAKDTSAIQAAIDAAGTAGGGIVRLSSGTYLSGTVYLKSNVRLQILPSATLLGSPDKADYNADDFCPQNIVFKNEKSSGAHLIVALEVENVSICGGGTIDGNGMAFWMKEPSNTDVRFPQTFKRPEWRPSQMLFFCESKNVAVRDIKLLNAPYWTCFFHGCDDVFVSGVFIKNDPRGHNNDGIDIDSCARVTVSDCIITSEDDSITLRAFSQVLKAKNKPCEDVCITNCILETRRAAALRLGVGPGLIRRCSISNVIVKNTNSGICFISSYAGKWGASIEDVSFSNMQIHSVRPVEIMSDNDWGKPESAGYIKNVSFDNINFHGSRTSLIAGNLDKKISDITFRNCRFVYSGGEDIPAPADEKLFKCDWTPVKTTSDAILIQNARDVVFDNCKLEWRNVVGAWKRSLRAVNSDNCAAKPNCDFPDCPPLK